MLFKGFTTSLAAIAIAFASFSAAPARADNDTAKIIAGVAALAIIGAAISDNRKDRRYASRYHGNHFYNPYYGHQRKVYRQHHYNHHKHYNHQKHYHAHKHYKFKRSNKRW